MPQPTDVSYAWGKYSPTDNLQWNNPQLIAGVGYPAGAGSVQSLDAEAGYFIWIVGGIPYGSGGNEFNSITQDSTVFYRTPAQAMCAYVDGQTFNWSAASVGATLPILQVDGGDHCNWAVDSVGKVFGWGNANNGCLGNNNTTHDGNNSTLIQPAPASVFAVGDSAGVHQLQVKAAYGAVTSGQTHFVVLMNGGSVSACGTDQYGECGDGITLPTASTTNPVPPGGGPYVTANFPYNPVPVTVVGGQQGGSFLANITTISAGNHQTLALDTSGSVWTWGHNAFGQLGDGTLNDSSSPRAVNWAGVTGAHPTPPITQISGGGGFVGSDGQSFAVDSKGQLFGWGANSYGQLGLGGNGVQNFGSPCVSPVNMMPSLQAAGMTGSVVAATSGTRHGMVLDSNNTLWVFGENTAGELGIPALSAPIPNSGGGIGTSTPTAINAGVFATLPNGSDHTEDLGWEPNVYGGFDTSDPCPHTLHVNESHRGDVVALETRRDALRNGEALRSIDPIVVIPSELETAPPRGEWWVGSPIVVR